MAISLVKFPAQGLKTRYYVDFWLKMNKKNQESWTLNYNCSKSKNFRYINPISIWGGKLRPPTEVLSHIKNLVITPLYLDCELQIGMVCITIYVIAR